MCIRDRSATDDGRTVFTGELAQGDQTLSSGEFAHVHTARVRPGQHVRIEMASPTFDTYLIVSGALTAQNDDIAPGRTMSRIEGVAGGDGQIRIVATSARSGETGRYLIVVLAQDAPFANDGESSAATAAPPPRARLSAPVSVDLPGGGRYRVIDFVQFSGARLRIDAPGGSQALRAQFSQGLESEPWVSGGVFDRTFTVNGQERVTVEAPTGALPPLRLTWESAPEGVARYGLGAGIAAIQALVESGSWRNPDFRTAGHDFEYYVLPVLLDELGACQGYPQSDGRPLLYCQIGYDREADARAAMARAATALRATVRGTALPVTTNATRQDMVGMRSASGDTYAILLQTFPRADMPFWSVSLYVNPDL